MREVTFGWLREAVRKEIRNAFEVQGYARPREVAQVVCALYRKGVSQMGERLVENAIAAMARRELKRYPAITEHAQLRVPGIPGALMAHLPPAISVPASGVDEEALSEDSVIYKPLSRAALADIDAHLELLAAQISADTRRHRALKELRDLALAAGATDNSPLLATLSTADLLMTEVVS